MKRKINFKNLILSVVALMLVMMLTISVTYSWIEDVHQVQFSTVEGGEDTPLKTGMDINAVATITQSESTINLGNILTDADLKYTEEGENKGKFLDGIDASSSAITQKKGYFYESGGMHLSPCYSDGTDFYFPVIKPNGVQNGTEVGDTTTTYRKGNKNDENVNYIDFTFKVVSATANTVYWFDEIPTIKDGSNNNIAEARVAITVDGLTKVFSTSGGASNGHTITSTTAASTTPYATESFAKYTYGNAANTNNEGEQPNINTLFAVPKGDEGKIVNVKIWVEGGISSEIGVSNINMVIASSWSKTFSLSFVDQTSGNWATKNNDSKFYLAFPEFQNGEWVLGTNYFLITMNGIAVSGIPAVYSGEKALIYRCNLSGWNQSNANTNQLPSGASYKINAYNYWETTLPDDVNGGGTYTIYGGSYDTSMATAIEGDSTKATHLGCGTWGSLHMLKVYSKYSCQENYFGHGGSAAVINYASDSGNMYLRDFSDESTAKTIYTYKMEWDEKEEGEEDGDYWWTYIPESSTLIQFYYYVSDSAKGWWGYRCDNNTCPQQRPAGVYTYQITGNYGTRGIAGYWEGHNCIYLIKNGSSSGITAKVYMWTPRDDNTTTHQNDSWPGPSIMDGYVFTTGSGDAVYKSKTIYHNVNESDGSDFIHMWAWAKFSDGVDSVKTGDLFIYPGCYYDFAAGKWYGSVDRKEINTNVSDSANTTVNLTAPSSQSPNSDGLYLLVQNSGNSYYKISDSGTSSSANASIKVALGESNNYTLWLIRRNNGSQTQYGSTSNDPSSYIDPSSSTFFDFQSSGNTPKYMHVSATGNYTITVSSYSDSTIRLTFAPE